MLSLTAQKRELSGKKVKALRQKGLLPAVLYGPKIKSQSLVVGVKEFEKIYQEAGESSLIELVVGKEKTPVLIHQLQRDPLTSGFLHVDFYAAPLTQEIEAKVPLVFEGSSPAVKELGGTLVKNMTEIEVKALPQDLPHDIKLDISGLKTFEDSIFVENLSLPEKVKVLKDSKEVIAHVVPPTKVEEELAKPIEEKVEEVEKVEEKKEERGEAPPPTETEEQTKGGQEGEPKKDEGAKRKGVKKEAKKEQG